MRSNSAYHAKSKLQVEGFGVVSFYQTAFNDSGEKGYRKFFDRAYRNAHTGLVMIGTGKTMAYRLPF